MIQGDLTLADIKANKARIERLAKMAYEAYMAERLPYIVGKDEAPPDFENLARSVRAAWRKVAIVIDGEVGGGS